MVTSPVDSSGGASASGAGARLPSPSRRRQAAGTSARPPNAGHNPYHLMRACPWMPHRRPQKEEE